MWSNRANRRPGKILRVAPLSRAARRDPEKVGEEATETVMAAKDGDRLRIVGETADLWFHCLIMLAQFGLRPEDVLAELRRREGISGIDERVRARTSSATSGAQVDGRGRLPLLPDRPRRIPSRKVYEDATCWRSTTSIRSRGALHDHPQAAHRVARRRRREPPGDPRPDLAAAPRLAREQGSTEGFRVTSTRDVWAGRRCIICTSMSSAARALGPMLKRN